MSSHITNGGLQLGDYTSGYRFACTCRMCNFTWYEQPGQVLARPGMHARMYLDEVAAALRCLRTRDHADKSRQRIDIIPIRDRETHHFIAGLA